MRSFLPLMLVLSICTALASAASPWPRHVIDDSLRGADGVRLADFDGDGRLDIVTGWEESGVVRLYLQPPAEQVKEPWPEVTVGESASPEDAVPIDWDGDGKIDVVSCHEGKNRRVFVHWNGTDGESKKPAEKRDALLEPSHWKTQEIESLRGQMWMFATPLELASRQTACVVASKGTNGSITLVIPSQDSPRALEESQIIRMRDAGWIMSLIAKDMDGDGDEDIVYSDRKGSKRGVGWLEHPDGPLTDAPWRDHLVGGQDHEVMFIDVEPSRIFVATRAGIWIDFARETQDRWQQVDHPNPPQVTFGKAIRRLPSAKPPHRPAGVVLTANTHVVAKERDQPGVWWIPDRGPVEAIDTPPGGKFDRIECLDLDGDGDADVLTCEERKNLGVIWYENPGY